MKKSKFNFLLITFSVMFLLVLGCKKKKTAPELSLLGDAIMQLCLGDSLVDPGFSSIDAYDVDISGTVDVTSNVNNGTSPDLVLKRIPVNIGEHAFIARGLKPHERS